MAVIKTVEKKCTPTSEMQKECPRCGAKNGTIKAFGLRLVHKKYTKKNGRDVSAFDTAIQMNANIQDHVQKLQEVLHPMNVRTLLENLSSEDRDLLDQPHPERYVLTHILVPPNSIRPSVPSPHDPDKYALCPPLSFLSHPLLCLVALPHTLPLSLAPALSLTLALSPPRSPTPSLSPPLPLFPFSPLFSRTYSLALTLVNLPSDKTRMNCDDLTNFVEKILMFNEELEAVLKKGEKLDQVHSVRLLLLHLLTPN